MRSLRALGLYSLLTVALTWPFAANLRVMDAGDSAFFAWEIGWTFHALETHPLELPNGNIFHPLKYTLGMDEPIFGTTLLGVPLAIFTDDAVFLYNVIRLLTFVLSALAAYWLARELGVGEWVALLAGALFAFSPVRTDQVAHLSTLGTQWLPLVLLFTIRFGRSGKWKDALLAALFFVLAFLACGYHGVIAVAVLPPVLLVLFWKRWRLLPRGAVAAAVAGVALLPLYLLHKAALEPEDYARGTEETVLYSAPVEAFLATSSWNRVYGEVTDFARTTSSNNLFPGLVVPVLIVAGAFVLWRKKEKPSREAMALAVMALAAAAVALGPEVRVFGHDLGPGPWRFLRDTVPVFQMIRVTSRAGALFVLPLVMLAALGLERLKPQPAALAAVGAIALAETLIVPIPMPEWSKIIDTRSDPPAVYRWLDAQPGEPVIAHLPMLDVYGLERRPAFHESIYMVYSTHHWKPLVNGYAGIEPRHYVHIRELMRSFPSEAFLDALREVGTRYVVVHRGGYGPNQWERLQRGMPRALEHSLREVASLDGDTVYELRDRVEPGAPDELTTEDDASGDVAATESAKAESTDSGPVDAGEEVPPGALDEDGSDVER